MKEILDFKYKERGKDELIHKKHSHSNCYEVLQIWSGEGVVMVKEKLYPLKSGAVYFINGMDIHCSAPRDSEGYIRSKMIISSEFIDQIAEITGSSAIIDDLFIKNGGTCIEPDQNEAAAIDEEMLKIRDSLTGESVYSKANIAAAALRIFLCAHSGENTQSQALTNKISEVLSYINRNINRKINLEELCDFVHTSKYYLCHVFKETTHMTIHEYILSRRISIAKKKLKYTDMPLSEIAMSSGFSSFSYFSKMFHAYEGITPGGYRKQQ